MTARSSRQAHPPIVTPGPDDVPALAAMIATAYHYLPVSQYLIRDPAERIRVFPELFRILIADALDRGTIYATEDLSAVALWMPVEAEGAPVPELDPRIARIGRDLKWRYLKLQEVLHERHPVGIGHHHLTFLAVRRDHQHQGLGSSLLGCRHAHLDRHHLPAYVEATNMTSRQLLREHGYIEHGEPIALPDQSRLYPLWRDAQGP